MARAEPEPNADPRVLQLLPGPDVPACLLALLVGDLGGDEASQGVQPRRLDLEDDVDPPQLMITGVQDKGEVNFPIMDTNKVMCEGT